jgi:hypothetical protein
MANGICVATCKKPPPQICGKQIIKIGLGSASSKNEWVFLLSSHNRKERCYCIAAQEAKGPASRCVHSRRARSAARERRRSGVSFVPLTLNYTHNTATKKSVMCVRGGVRARHSDPVNTLSVNEIALGCAAEIYTDMSLYHVCSPAFLAFWFADKLRKQPSVIVLVSHHMVTNSVILCV